MSNAVCPLRLEEIVPGCIGSGCTWYDITKKQCILFSIAKYLRRHREEL